MFIFSKLGAWVVGIATAIAAALGALFVTYEKGKSTAVAQADANALKQSAADGKTGTNIAAEVAQLPPSRPVTVPAPLTTPVITTAGAPVAVGPPALADANPDSAAGRLNVLAGGS